MSVFVYHFGRTSNTISSFSLLKVLFTYTSSLFFLKYLQTTANDALILIFIWAFHTLASPFIGIIYLINSTRQACSFNSIESTLALTIKGAPFFTSFSNVCQFHCLFIWRALVYWVFACSIRWNAVWTVTISIFINQEIIVTYALTKFIFSFSIRTIYTICVFWSWTRWTIDVTSLACRSL